jgi:methylated-DNA-[protein]-cysteine S-methyltransferase
VIQLTARNDALVVLHFLGESPRDHDRNLATTHEVLQEAVSQLSQYFLGTRRNFNLPIHLQGTPFQCSVWKSLLRIDFGKVVSYKDIAKAIENPRASRAVGRALGKNPIPIVIPCHRVVNHNGGLGGFSSGLSIKRQLLALEHAPLPSLQAL